MEAALEAQYVAFLMEQTRYYNKPVVDLKPTFSRKGVSNGSSDFWYNLRPSPKIPSVEFAWGPMVNPSPVCCGLSEIGGFEMISRMPFDVQVDILQRAMNESPHSAWIATTNDSQRYVIPALEKLGFKNVQTFNNANTDNDVKVWMLIYPHNSDDDDEDYDDE